MPTVSTVMLRLLLLLFAAVPSLGKNCTEAQLACKPSCSPSKDPIGQQTLLLQRVCKLCKCRQCKHCAAVGPPDIGLSLQHHTPTSLVRRTYTKTAKSITGRERTPEKPKGAKGGKFAKGSARVGSKANKQEKLKMTKHSWDDQIAHASQQLRPPPPPRSQEQQHQQQKKKKKKKKKARAAHGSDGLDGGSSGSGSNLESTGGRQWTIIKSSKLQEPQRKRGKLKRGKNDSMHRKARASDSTDIGSSLVTDGNARAAAPVNNSMAYRLPVHAASNSHGKATTETNERRPAPKVDHFAESLGHILVLLSLSVLGAFSTWCICSTVINRIRKPKARDSNVGDGHMQLPITSLTASPEVTPTGPEGFEVTFPSVDPRASPLMPPTTSPDLSPLK